MSIRQRICFIAACDTPGCTPYDDHDFVPYFDSEEEAVENLVTNCHWTRDGDLLFCPACTARRECEQKGHRWWQWGGDPDTGVTNQSCERCDAHQLVATPTIRKDVP